MLEEYRELSSKWLWNNTLKATSECQRDIEGTMELGNMKATMLNFMVMVERDRLIDGTKYWRQIQEYLAMMFV